MQVKLKVYYCRVQQMLWLKKVKSEDGKREGLKLKETSKSTTKAMGSKASEKGDMHM